MILDHPLLSIVRSLVVVLGLLITFMAFRAYKRSGHGSLFLAGIGFLLIASAALLAGILFEISGYSLVDVVIFESTMIAMGLLAILFSIRRLH